jgi:hypothetical protein
MQSTVLKQIIFRSLFAPVDFIAKIWLTIELIHSYKFGRINLFMFLFLSYVTGYWLCGLLALVAGALFYASAFTLTLTLSRWRGITK